MNQQTVIEAADRLWAAARTGVATAPVRTLVGTEDLSAAYAVQRRAIGPVTSIDANGAPKSGCSTPSWACTAGQEDMIVDIALEHLKNHPSVPPIEQELSA